MLYADYLLYSVVSTFNALQQQANEFSIESGEARKMQRVILTCLDVEIGVTAAVTGNARTAAPSAGRLPPARPAFS